MEGTITMEKYIFLTKEGYTFQPNSEMIEPDIENLQVIGFAGGKNSEVAFENLIEQNPYLKDTSFKEVISYQLDSKYELSKRYHNMK